TPTAAPPVRPGGAPSADRLDLCYPRHRHTFAGPLRFRRPDRFAPSAIFRFFSGRSGWPPAHRRAYLGDGQTTPLPFPTRRVRTDAQDAPGEKDRELTPKPRDPESAPAARQEERARQGGPVAALR